MVVDIPMTAVTFHSVGFQRTSITGCASSVPALADTKRHRILSNFYAAIGEKQRCRKCFRCETYLFAQRWTDRKIPSRSFINSEQTNACMIIESALENPPLCNL